MELRSAVDPDRQACKDKLAALRASNAALRSPAVQQRFEEEKSTRPMERDNFLVVSLMSPQQLSSFLELLQRLHESTMKQHFDCWKHAYMDGYLDMPSLATSSEDEEFRRGSHEEAMSDSDEDSSSQ